MKKIEKKIFIFNDKIMHKDKDEWFAFKKNFNIRKHYYIENVYLLL